MLLFSPCQAGDCRRREFRDAMSERRRQCAGWARFARGDINGDGEVNLVDWLLLQQFLNDQAGFNAKEFLRADLYPVDGDGQLTLSDLLLFEELAN